MYVVRRLIQKANQLGALALLSVSAVGATSVLSGCNDATLGFQGGVVPEQFTGITSAAAISPQSIQLNWNAYPGSNKYKVYVSDKNEAVYQPGFTSIIFQPIPLDPTRTYLYSVTAVDPSTGQEVGDRTAYNPVQLLEHFNFKNSGNAVAIGKTALRVVWDGKPAVTYKVYVAERLPTGLVNYNSFVSSTASVVGMSSATVTGLLEGHEYCAIVVAAYSDGNNDGPDGTMFSTEIGSTLSGAAWMTGASGTFGDSKISQNQKCVRTQSDFSIANLRVYAPKATLVSKPTFYVDVPGDTTEDTSGPVETSIYQVDSASGLASFIGKRTGTGKITATSSILQGRYKFFSVVTDLQGAAHAQDRKEIVVGPNGTLPTDEASRPWIYIRSFNANEDPASPIGYYPEKQQGGFGSQSAGQSVAMGDFNCDGKYDIAVGIPDASLMANDNLPAKQGKVVIYYDVNSGTPTTTSRSQVINFDITQYAGNNGRNLRLGTRLYVGNFNKDNQLTNQYGGASENANYQCDDLVIGSGYGPMFVLYGKRDISGPNGGLNFTNPTSFTVNPSTSCDPSTNVCETAMYTTGTGYTATIASALSAGDFNGDGYLDLVASIAGSGILVFRGSEFGLIPPVSYPAESINYPSGPYAGFPYIPKTPANFAPKPTPQPGWTSSGASVAPLYNAYYDVNPSNLTQGTKRVRDILLVGNPTYNRVHACRPETDFSITPVAAWTDDPNKNLFWNCSFAINAPTKTTSSTSTTYNGSFGAAMAPIKNPLRYQPNQFQQSGCDDGNPNCSQLSMKLGYPGAVAVGAPGVGASFVYYVPSNPSAFVSRDTWGNGRNTLVAKMFQQTRSNGSSDQSRDCTYNTTPSTSLCVESDNPCKLLGSGAEYCDIQILTHPTTSSGSFGSVIAAFPGNNSPDPVQPKDSIIAIAAPYRNITVSGGISYNSVGSVQLYMQNSNFSSNPIVVLNSATPRQSDGSCPTDQICRYADGFSNTLTSSIDYDATLGNNVNFGLGGIAAGPLSANISGTTYNTNSDIVVGAPGHIARITQGSNTVKVYDNGAAMTYFSHGGTYRTYQTTETGPNPSSWHLIEKSYSQESDIKFQLVTSIGDLNFDGVDDVAVRINSGSKNKTRILFGKTDKVGVSVSAGSYQDIEVPGDASAGKRFIPLGKITNGQFPAYLITGKNDSYIYFAGISGLIQGAPSTFGLGGTPRRLSAQAKRTDPTFGDTIYYLDFSDSTYPNAEINGDIDSTEKSLASFAHGDFNGDGHEDFAMTMTVTNVADTSKLKGCPLNYCFGAPTPSQTKSRVMVFYGGIDNGLQTQPDSNGGYPLTDQFISDYSIENTATPSTFGAPCSVSDGNNCKIQMLTEGSLLAPISSYGDTITSVPLGNCVVNGNNVPVSGLAVQAGSSSGTAIIYVYKPKCLQAPGDLSGLVGMGDSKLVIPAASATSPTMGYSMAVVKNIMGSGSQTLGHLIVSDQSLMRIYSYPILPIDGLYKNIQPVTDTADGGRTIDYSASNMMAGLSGSSVGFGTEIADLGDLNGDGYGDVGIGMTRLTRTDINTQRISQGAVLILFGNTTGLQSHVDASLTTSINPVRNALCYTSPTGNAISSTCYPTLLYLPQSTNSIRDGAYERIYLGPYSRLNFGSLNENLGSFLIGVPGRDSLDALTSDRILNGGAFYVLP
ncbi:MAG: hypothetical protein JST80_06980 [Bdellovibrionales bacterium]|nr:hypothetical protein [Bdellovibrionales bacterium]